MTTTTTEADWLKPKWRRQAGAGCKLIYGFFTEFYVMMFLLL